MASGSTIHSPPAMPNCCLAAPVTAIHWRRVAPVRVETKRTQGSVEVFEAAKAIITLPLGILQAQPGEAGAVRFVPDLKEKQEAMGARLKMGSVVKVILRFRESFWEQKRGLADLAFIHPTAGPFGACWTGLPVRAPVLTLWAGGPGADALSFQPPAKVLDQSIVTLAAIFSMRRRELAGLLEAWHICDWPADPFSRGAYSYVKVDGVRAVHRLALPIANTLFFAGEATVHGMTGTVNGAIASGRRAAREVLSQ